MVMRQTTCMDVVSTAKVVQSDLVFVNLKILIPALCFGTIVAQCFVCVEPSLGVLLSLFAKKITH